MRVAGDDVIFEKGRVPFQTQAERLITVLALKPVNGVCATLTLAAAILEYKPTHVVKGIDWQGKIPPDVEAACLITGTEIVLVRQQSRSSRERLGGS